MAPHAAPRPGGRTAAARRLPVLKLALAAAAVLVLAAAGGARVSIGANFARGPAAPAGVDALRMRLRNRGAASTTAPPVRSTEATPHILAQSETATLLKSINSPPRGSRPNCSVVGNDSSMRDKGLGAKIDAAGRVYRMNFAPLKNFADDVGSRSDTQCLNPKKLRQALAENPRFVTDNGNAPERVFVVGDLAGRDLSSDAADANAPVKPCIESSPGGLCITRTDNERAQNMDAAVQRLTEELLMTMQAGVGEEAGVPTTGLYCLVLALVECDAVNVYGIGAGTIAKTNLGDLEYFKDPHFQGWDVRHNAEAERTLLRVLASRVWSTQLTSLFGSLHWHNPLLATNFVNANLLEPGPCTSGIRC